MKEDGTVWASGDNRNGQLGNGTTNNSSEFARVQIDENTYLKDIIKIDIEDYSVVALDKNGEVYAWGQNSYGQLGQGNTNIVKYATKIKNSSGIDNIQNIINIEAGTSDIFLMDIYGEVYGIGYNGDYSINETGVDYYYPKKIESFSNVIEMDGGASNIMVMCADSNIWVRGYNQIGVFGDGSVAVKNGKTYVGNDINEISMHGYVNTIIKKEDNTIWSTGWNDYGCFGVGNESNTTVFVQMKLENGEALKAKYICGGRSNVAIVGKDGKLYVSGDNGYGQLSDGTTSNVVYPKLIKFEDNNLVENIIGFSVSSGYQGSYKRTLNISFIKNDGSVWISGDNSYGQYGNGTTISSLYLTQSNINVFSEETVISIQMISNAINKIM